MLSLSVASSHAADPYIYRVGGTVTAQNFPGLAAFAMNSVDQFVGLKISVAEGSTRGQVETMENDGTLSVFMRDVDVNLAFSSGYRKSNGNYFIEGYYKVTYGGMHQGINGLGLAPARSMDVDATGKQVKPIEIDRLKADIGN